MIRNAYCDHQKDHRVLQEIAKNDRNNEDIFEKKSHRYSLSYRPNSMDSVYLYNFVSKYDW